MIDLPLTSLFAGLFAIALVMLSLMVTIRRAQTKQLLGDADEVLSRRIRAQGNFVEYVPLGLILLGLMEMQGAAPGAVLTIGALLAIGRLMHAIGMYRDSAIFRGLGILPTYGALAAGGIMVVLAVN